MLVQFEGREAVLLGDAFGIACPEDGVWKRGGLEKENACLESVLMRSVGPFPASEKEPCSSVERVWDHPSRAHRDHTEDFQSGLTKCA